MLEALNQFVELATGIVVGHTPDGALGRIGHNACRLRVNELVVVFQAQFIDFSLVLTVVNLFDRLAHDTVVTGNHGILQAEINIALFINRTLEKSVGPGVNV